MARLSPRWTLSGGRWLYLDGKPAFALQRADGLEPVQADTLAHVVCDLLNRAAVDLATDRPAHTVWREEG